jgi:hypothetical protein
MLPPIVIVDGVEMIRDGGSLAAIFHANDSCEYWLFFEIRMFKSNPNVAERLGYAEPKVVNRYTNIEVGITWEHAAMMLRQIEKLTHINHDLQWLKKMQAVADSNNFVWMRILSMRRTSSTRGHSFSSSAASGRFRPVAATHGFSTWQPAGLGREQTLASSL